MLLPTIPGYSTHHRPRLPPAPQHHTGPASIHAVGRGRDQHPVAAISLVENLRAASFNTHEPRKARHDIRRSPSSRTRSVALTIDIEGHPREILVIRGRAELDVVDGIPPFLARRRIMRGFLDDHTARINPDRERPRTSRHPPAHRHIEPA